MHFHLPRPRAALLVGAALAAISAPACASAPLAPSASADAAAAASDIAEGSEITVTATKANELAPVTASLKKTQPAFIVSRSLIEESLPASADFNDIALISPSVSNTGGENGVGLNEPKTQIRGFHDGEYNITYAASPSVTPTTRRTTRTPSSRRTRSRRWLSTAVPGTPASWARLRTAAT